MMPALLVPRTPAVVHRYYPGHCPARTWPTTLSHLSIEKLWTISLVSFACCMCSTSFTTSVFSGYLIMGITGLSWAAAAWVPISVISAEMSKFSDQHVFDTLDDTRTGAQVGFILGLHNIAISMPQVISCLVSGIIFWVCDQDVASASRDDIGLILSLAGLSALYAAYLARGLHTNVQE